MKRRTSATTCRWQAALARQRRNQQDPDARSSSQSVPCNIMEGERGKGAAWHFRVLAQRAVADSPRWTRARWETVRPALTMVEGREGSAKEET